MLADYTFLFLSRWLRLQVSCGFVFVTIWHLLPAETADCVLERLMIVSVYLFFHIRNQHALTSWSRARAWGHYFSFPFCTGKHLQKALPPSPLHNRYKKGHWNTNSPPTSSTPSSSMSLVKLDIWPVNDDRLPPTWPRDWPRPEPIPPSHDAMAHRGGYGPNKNTARPETSQGAGG